MMVQSNQMPDKEKLVLQLRNMVRDQIERVGTISDPEDAVGLYFLTTHFHQPSRQGV